MLGLYKHNMNYTLSSSISDVGLSFCGNIRSRNQNYFVPETFARIGDSNTKDKFQRSHHDARKMIISSHLVPRPLEGTTLKKQLEAPVKKLELIRTLLIDNYDSYTYNIFQELSVINGCESSLSLSH